MTWWVANNTAVRRSMPLPTEHAPRQAMGFREWPFRSASSHPALREVSAGCEEVFEPRLLGDPLGVPHRTAAGIGGLGCLYDTRSWRLIGLVVSSAGSSLTSTRSIAVGSHCRSHSCGHNRAALDVPQRLTLSPLFVVRSCRWIRVDRLWPLACASGTMRPYAHASIGLLRPSSARTLSPPPEPRTSRTTTGRFTGSAPPPMASVELSMWKS